MNIKTYVDSVVTWTMFVNMKQELERRIVVYSKNKKNLKEYSWLF